MVWARRFWLRLQTLFRRDRNAKRLDDEIQFHLDQQIAENLAAGMSAQEARYAAMRAFGNPTFLKEETRDTWGWTWLEQVAQDLRYGSRTLGKNPVFSGLLAYAPFLEATLGGENPKQLTGAEASCNFFDVLRERPALGRTFVEEDCRAPGASPVVVLGYELWRSRFDADPSIVGR